MSYVDVQAGMNVSVIASLDSEPNLGIMNMLKQAVTLCNRKIHAFSRNPEREKSHQCSHQANIKITVTSNTFTILSVIYRNGKYSVNPLSVNG